MNQLEHLKSIREGIKNAIAELEQSKVLLPVSIEVINDIMASVTAKTLKATIDNLGKPINPNGIRQAASLIHITPLNDNVVIKVSSNITAFELMSNEPKPDVLYMEVVGVGEMVHTLQLGQMVYCNPETDGMPIMVKDNPNSVQAARTKAQVASKNGKGNTKYRIENYVMTSAYNVLGVVNEEDAARIRNHHDANKLNIFINK